jgi:hypothetical protein
MCRLHYPPIAPAAHNSSALDNAAKNDTIRRLTETPNAPINENRSSAI